MGDRMSDSIIQVDKIIKNNASALTLVNPTIQGSLGSSIGKTVSYVITDTDNYSRIACDTTGGDITITLPLKGNNIGRRIEIANVKGGTNKVIISPNATDANKLSNDGLNVIWLPKIGDYAVFQEDATSGFWEIVSERITSQLRLYTHAGYGGTDTKIPRWTNLLVSNGNFFTENHSTGYSSNAKGLEVTIQRSGKWGFTWGGYFFNDYVGFTLNSAQLTTGIVNCTETDILSFDYAPNDGFGVPWTGYLKKGDIFRPHTGAANAPGGGSRSVFTASYLG